MQNFLDLLNNRRILQLRRINSFEKGTKRGNTVSFKVIWNSYVLPKLCYFVREVW